MENLVPRRNQGLRRLLEIAGQKKTTLIWSSIFSILSAAVALVPFVVIYYLSFELLSPAINKSYVSNLTWAALGAVICRFIFKYLSVVLSHIAAYDVLYGLRKQLTEHLANLPMGYFTKKSSGSIKKILNDDVEEIKLFISHHIPDIVTGVALPLMTIVFLFFKDWRLALTALVPLFLAYWAQRAAFSDSSDLTEKYHQAMETMNSTIIEYVRGMPVIKVFNQTVQSFTGFTNSVTDFTELCEKWSKKATPSYAVFLVMINSILFFILPVGVWLFIEGSLKIPVFILFVLLGLGYSVPLIRVANYRALISQIKEGVGRIDGILDQPRFPEPLKPRLPKSCEIEFRNVSFAYEDKYVLRNINLKIKEKSVTALVGPSGAGKTTIAQLIPRFWDVSEGEILMGGARLKDIPFEELMNRVTFVFQDVFLFQDTILENIRMGQEEITENEVVNAAKIAQAHDFIVSLPNGYHTVFGAAGVYLSGGEQQRVSLARAVLKNAPVVILDEATAFADPENEAKIQQAFTGLMDDKTVIVIAHRLSTIRNADQIVVIDEGRIIERGTHDELLASGGLYKNMWEAHISSQDWKFEVKEDEA